MHDNLEKNVIATLAYFDIFSYPLTLNQIIKYCESEIDDLNEFKELLEGIPVIKESGGYYCLINRDEIIQKRKEKEDISIKKIARVEIITRILSIIPSILLIGISGSLSMRNADSGDDIDIFIVTKKNSLWITRLLVNTILVSLGQKRGRRDKHARNKICPNMFVCENALTITKKERNFYIAHEIAQLRVIYNKESTYEKFVRRNNWINKYFPNFIIPKSIHSASNKIPQWVEYLDSISYKFQSIYMKGHKSIEKISRNTAKFHPVDKGKLILELYEYRLDNYFGKYQYLKWAGKEDAAFYFTTDKQSRIIN